MSWYLRPPSCECLQRRVLEWYHLRMASLSSPAVPHHSRAYPLTLSDWITSQSTGNIELGHNLMSDVRRLVYLLRLNHAVPREGMNVIDRELSRRLYWEAYAIDK